VARVRRTRRPAPAVLAQLAAEAAALPCAPPEERPLARLLSDFTDWQVCLGTRGSLVRKLMKAMERGRWRTAIAELAFSGAPASGGCSELRARRASRSALALLWEAYHTDLQGLRHRTASAA